MTLSPEALPSHLLLPNSKFSSEVKSLIVRHLQDSHDAAAVALTKREAALWSDPYLIFFQSRSSFHRFGTGIYDKSTKTLRLIKDGDTVDGVRVLPIYQISRTGYREDLGESPVRIQARSTNMIIHHDERDDVDHLKRAGDIKSWLGSTIIELAESPSTAGSWVPYVRSLIGLSDRTPIDPNAEATPIDIPLSSLIVLFAKCSTATTKAFPWVKEGSWFLPTIEGNKGKDEHIFYNATDEVVVEVK